MSARVFTFLVAGALLVGAVTSSFAQNAPAAAKTSPGAGPIIVVETEKGTFEFETYPNEAPKTVAHIVGLVNKKFYNGQRVHRVVKDFVIQMGDPLGTGMGGSAETIPLEAVESLTHSDGAVGMARSQDPNSASSQFYICDGAQHGLDGNYAVFGQVIEGMEVVRAIASVKVDAQKKPLEDVIMTKVYIE